MDKVYISEFELFMEHFMHDHPEVVADQQIGYDMYWKQQVAELPCDW